MRSVQGNVLSFIRELSGVDSTQVSDTLLIGILDQYREDVSQTELVPLESRIIGGEFEYRRYRFPEGGYWEEVSLSSESGPISFDLPSSQLEIGIFALTTSVDPPVYASGILHDPYAVAADLYDLSMRSQQSQPDFIADGLTVIRSKANLGIRAQSSMLRSKARLRSMQIYRGDT